MLFNPSVVKNYDSSPPLLYPIGHHSECVWEPTKDITIIIQIYNELWGNTNAVIRINNMEMLSDNRGYLPVLRYNGIIKKWFCADPYDFKDLQRDTDEAELNYLKDIYECTIYDEASGFFDDPLAAISFWNRNSALLISSCYIEE